MEAGGIGELNSSVVAGEGATEEVTVLLRAVVADGFTFHLCGDPPRVLLASYPWDGYVDLLTIVGPDEAGAARAVKTRGFDLFRPSVVVWAFTGTTHAAVRELLALAHPDHPDRPTASVAVPTLMRLPEHLRRHVRVKPPELTRAGQREVRLTTELTTRPDHAAPLDRGHRLSARGTADKEECVDSPEHR